MSDPLLMLTAWPFLPPAFLLMGFAATVVWSFYWSFSHPFGIKFCLLSRRPGHIYKRRMSWKAHAHCCQTGQDIFVEQKVDMKKAPKGQRPLGAV